MATGLNTKQELDKTCTWGECMGQWGQPLSDASTGQGMPRPLARPQQLGRGLEQILPTASEGTSPVCMLVLASRLPEQRGSSGPWCSVRTAQP